MDDKRFKEMLAKKRKIAKGIEKKKKYKPKKHKYSTAQYKRQYQAVEWKELRERIILRDKNRCVSCGCKSHMFHIHHLLYEADKKIWEVPDYYLVTLCPSCHKKEHSRILFAPKKHR